MAHDLGFALQQHKCDNCKQTAMAQKRLSVFRFPDILVLRMCPMFGCRVRAGICVAISMIDIEP